MCYHDIPEDLWLRLEPILPTESFAREIRFVENRIFPIQALAEKRISDCYP